MPEGVAAPGMVVLAVLEAVPRKQMLVAVYTSL